MLSGKRKALWAVDPQGTDKDFQLQVGKSVSQLMEGTAVEIEPVAILPCQISEEIRVEKQNLVESWMNEAAFPNVSSPVFLAQPSFSTQSAIHALLDYADEREVELIAVGTHSKQALERFFVGSFAETLVLASVYPVFLVSPHNQQNLKKDRILFPTDFSEKSHIVFEKLLPTALEKHAKVVLFHKTPVEVPPPVFGFDPIPVYEVFLAQDKKEKEKLAETWREEAFRQGVEVEILFHDLPGYPVDAILSNALSQRCGMIALASESGATAATLLGSMSRQIMRHAPCPVWILHPAEKRVN